MSLSLEQWTLGIRSAFEEWYGANSITISVSYCSKDFILFIFRWISEYCRRCGKLMPTNYEMIRNSVCSSFHNDDLAHLWWNHKIWTIPFLHWTIATVLNEEFPPSNNDNENVTHNEHEILMSLSPIKQSVSGCNDNKYFIRKSEIERFRCHFRFSLMLLQKKKHNLKK